MALQRKDCPSREIAAHLRTEIMSGKIPPGAMLASIRTLAKEYGVGAQTVVSAFALLEKDRIIQSLPRRGFRVADPLPQGKFLAIVYRRTEGDSYFINGVISEFEAVCRERGAAVNKMYADLFNSIAPEKLEEMFREENYTGVLLCNSAFIGLEPELCFLRRARLPVVLPDARPGDREITRFAVLNRACDTSWLALLRHLKERGFRKIGALGGMEGNDLADGKRTADLGCSTVRTHFDFLRELELEIPEDPLLFISLEEKARNKAKFARWLEDIGRFDAVICSSDFYAMQFYEFCRESGIAIPGDLAVASFGNNTGAKLLSPPLTSVDYLPRKAAEQAFELLFDSADWFGPGKEAPCMDRDFRVVARASTDSHAKTKSAKNASRNRKR